MIDGQGHGFRGLAGLAEMVGNLGWLECLGRLVRLDKLDWLGCLGLLSSLSCWANLVGQVLGVGWAGRTCVHSSISSTIDLEVSDGIELLTTWLKGVVLPCV